MHRKILAPVALLAAVTLVPADSAGAQEGEANDTLPQTFPLDTLTVEAGRGLRHMPMPEIEGTRILAAKKTDIVRVDAGDANLARNVGRMAFARIPGANLWDMDGAGTQINISTRGTDAHRAIEMNLRQNGYTTNSDIVGYPEAHYTPPLQAIQRVELVRGSSSLQFGSQFGGMMNYVMKDGDPDAEFEVESEQTFGSDNFFNSYNAVGGTTSGVQYYAYFDHRSSDGWRPNSAVKYNAMYASVRYELGDGHSAALQFSRMDYRQQIAGGLTDAMFEEDPGQSTRSRNFFSPAINIPALIHEYELSPSTRIETKLYGLWGDRSSLQFIAPPTVADSVNPELGTREPRQVDRDFYKSVTLESTLLHDYDVAGLGGALTTGVRYFNGRTDRKQDGPGTAGSEFTFRMTGDYGIDLNLDSRNYAAFVENVLELGPRLALTAGARYEVIESNLDGEIDEGTFPVSYDGDRSFALFGAGLQFQASPSSEVYANATQSYRPYLYSQITPADRLSEVDPDLQDVRGHQLDLGYRGNVGELLTFDVNAYRVFYGDRIGTVTRTLSGGETQLFTTNIGDAVAQGFESYVEVSLPSLLNAGWEETDLRVFSSLALTHARYRDAEIGSGAGNVSIDGNMVENVPEWISRAGLQVSGSGLTATLQHSYTTRQFSDANNTEFNPQATSGVIPAYGIWDLAASWSFYGDFSASAGVNNLTDNLYFSRRIDRYPGPGILPVPGRTFYLSLGVGMD